MYINCLLPVSLYKSVHNPYTTGVMAHYCNIHPELTVCIPTDRVNLVISYKKPEVVIKFGLHNLNKGGLQHPLTPPSSFPRESVTNYIRNNPPYPQTTSM